MSSKNHTSKSHHASEKHEIFVGGLPSHTNKQLLYGYFKAFGRILKCQPQRWKSGAKKCRGFAIVRCGDKPTMDRILAKKDHFFEGRMIECKPCLKKSKLKKYNKELNARKVFIGCLPLRVTSETLKRYFQKVGPVEMAYVVSDEKGHSKGIGFVIFAEKRHSDEVIAKRRFQLEGSTVICAEYRNAFYEEKKKYNPGHGGDYHNHNGSGRKEQGQRDGGYGRRSEHRMEEVEPVRDHRESGDQQNQYLRKSSKNSRGSKFSTRSTDSGKKGAGRRGMQEGGSGGSDDKVNKTNSDNTLQKMRNPADKVGAEKERAANQHPDDHLEWVYIKKSRLDSPKHQNHNLEEMRMQGYEKSSQPDREANSELHPDSDGAKQSQSHNKQSSVNANPGSPKNNESPEGEEESGQEARYQPFRQNEHMGGLGNPSGMLFMSYQYLAQFGVTGDGLQYRQLQARREYAGRVSKRPFYPLAPEDMSVPDFHSLKPTKQEYFESYSGINKIQSYSGNYCLRY